MRPPGALRAARSSAPPGRPPPSSASRSRRLRLRLASAAIRCPQELTLLGVERRGRLVEQQHARLAEEGEREVEALPHPDRVRRRRRVGKPELRRRGLSVQPCEELEVLARRQPPVERRPLRRPADPRRSARRCRCSARARRRGWRGASTSRPRSGRRAPRARPRAARRRRARARAGRRSCATRRWRRGGCSTSWRLRTVGEQYPHDADHRSRGVRPVDVAGRSTRPPGAGSPGTAAGSRFRQTGLWCRAWLRPDNGTPRACVRAGDVHLGSESRSGTRAGSSSPSSVRRSSS